MLRPGPIHEGPLAQRRCFILGCWLRGDSGSGASAPWAEGSGSGKSPAGWSSKRVRMGRPPGCPPGARHHPRPGVARVSPRYCPGMAAVSPRRFSHVDAINMGETPGRYRGGTREIPGRLAWGYAGGGPGILNSEQGTRHRPPSQVIGLASSFPPRPAWPSRRGPASNACLSGAGLEKVVFTPPSLKSRRGRVQRKR